MSIHDYKEGRELEARDTPFYALIQAAMRRADTTNLEMMKGCWPEVWTELVERYNSPGGYLKEELEELEKGK